ncbi:MAG TPA: response regulator [Candidatus Sulfotelmatobacter sp.]|nr:response regulator [Candidatus Sulfotelmatobacter sp.]
MQLKDATLLVVDDEPYYCEIAKDWFEREGCRVLIAENGVAALQLLENEKADAIITDIRMPCMDGVDLVRHLKASGSYTPTAIALTGFSDVSARDAYDLGIEAQLSKPVSRKVLIAAVQAALNDRKQVWTTPAIDVRSGCHEIRSTFGSLQSARDNHQIAFGRGGFCLRSEVTIPDDTGIEFQFSFELDRQRLCGHGIVRWICVEEQHIGVEIMSIEEGIEWIDKLAKENASVSFIPRTT